MGQNLDLLIRFVLFDNAESCEIRARNMTPAVSNPIYRCLLLTIVYMVTYCLHGTTS